MSAPSRPLQRSHVLVRLFPPRLRGGTCSLAVAANTNRARAEGLGSALDVGDKGHSCANCLVIGSGRIDGDSRTLSRSIVIAGIVVDPRLMGGYYRRPPTSTETCTESATRGRQARS